MLLQDIESIRCDKLRRNIHTLSKQDLATSKEAPLIDAIDTLGTQNELL